MQIMPLTSFIHSFIHDIFSFVKLTPEKPLSLSAFTLCINAVYFSLPHLSIFQTHLLFQIYRKGLSIRPGGTILLGQDPDAYVSTFDAEQSFVGEVTDVHMWDYVLSGSQIKAVYLNQEPYVPKGNVFDWNTIKYEINGNVVVARNN
uniref:Pentraxin (PTX) domain-containing protein n=1 Tax=Cyprinus carpio TaxID=7962 RepID=A0A8C1Q783_CYPCA